MVAIPRRVSCLFLVLCLTACRVTTVPRPVPAVTPAPETVGLRPLRAGHPLLAWAPEQDPALTTPALARYAEAREAVWNRQAPIAAEGFAALLASASPAPVPPTNHLRHLVLQSHELVGDWAGSLTWYGRLGMEADHPHRREFARTLAAFPARTLEWEVGSRPIPFELHRGHLVIIGARMQGRPVRLLVDTGFTLSFVTAGFAAANGVQVSDETIRISDANSSDSQGRLARVDLMELGPLTLRNLPVVTAPPRLLQRLAGPIDGVLGWDVLRDLEVTWDFPAQQMILRPPSAVNPGTNPNLAGSELPILKLTGANGHPLYLFFDSGLASHSVQLDGNAGLLASRLDLRPFRRSIRPQVSVAMHSFQVAWPRRAKSFVFHSGGHRFEVPGAVLSGSLHLREGLVAVDGTVGNAPFLSGRLTLDATHRRFRWEPAL